MNPTAGLDNVVAQDGSLLADPANKAQMAAANGTGEDQGEGLKIYDDVDIRSPRANQTSNSQIDRLDEQEENERII